MSVHEPVNGICKHCGSRHPEQHMICVPRPDNYVAGMRPEPSRRMYAIEDWDTIAARIADLDNERTEALNRAEVT